jgi:TonB-dependent SusC/RagA subfamily outer membrane receptor
VIPPAPPAPTPPAIRIRPDTSLGNAQFIGTISTTGSITPPPAVTTPPVGLSVRRLAGGDVVIQGTPPLVIIDGVIQLGRDPADALDIDPTIIKSIEVVRGAAAVALYGERAANGVINITTKR